VWRRILACRYFLIQINGCSPDASHYGA
jgi:hypothetical protein